MNKDRVKKKDDLALFFTFHLRRSYTGYKFAKETLNRSKFSKKKNISKKIEQH